ncbi:undecaprenyl diphosphate synthase family protein [Halalkalirubrum salinum]|uniref:undecaprenyl diphosphate synthase family protein n=1 Tax=Halalkalirubrum salinum TaxID=2563889 RepID=UPI0010FB1F0B|nr:undecaprenyl diphosphate synthase family protein [Halalkalirubrum salinum]
MRLYDTYLGIRVTRHDAPPPEHVAIVLTERDLLEKGAYSTLESLLGWVFEYGSSRVTISVSVLDEAVIPTLRRQLAAVDATEAIAIRGPDDTDPADTPIRVNIGLGGKHEFAAAVARIAADVEAGELTTTDIDDETIADRLVFPDDPDLLIKTGAERLSDFMIWQSVYSELYFTDVNWRDLRKRDYLRAILDYKNRQRRFGR